MCHKKYSIVIAEDEPLILENIIEKIEKCNERFTIVASASNGMDALKAIEKVKPDLLFTDVRMPIMDGIELIREVRRIYPDIYIVILSGFSEFSYAQQAMKLDVRDYLLKPLKLDQLVEVLSNIYEKLSQRINSVESEIIISTIYGNKAAKTIPSSLQEARFVLYLTCIGNLQKAAVPSTESLNYSEIWKRIDWDKILGKVWKPFQKWWVIDERVPNEKFLILAIGNETERNIIDCADMLKDTLLPITHPFNITLCTDYISIDYSHIWQTAQKLRSYMEQGLVPGSSSIVVPELINNRKLPSTYIDIVTENGIKKLIEHKDLSMFHKQFMTLLQDWNRNSYPQLWIENALSQFVGIIYRQLISPAFDINEIEAKISDTIAVSTNTNDLCDKLWHLFEDLLLKNNLVNDTTEDIINKVGDYIKTNLTKDLRLEEIADRFSFNPSYLIRIFKRYKGETPLQYLIFLRIEEAKRLMVNNPDLDMKYISEIIGYPDQHYFSRVFKNVTGISPSEYKENLISLDK